MTREEIIAGLQFTVDMFLFNPNTGENREDYEINDMDKTTIDACKCAIELLKQEPKVGHWKCREIFYNGESRGAIITCSECGNEIKVSSKVFENLYSNERFCNHCGAKMESEELDENSN